MRALAGLVRAQVSRDRSGTVGDATISRRGFVQGSAAAGLTLSAGRGTSPAAGRERVAIIGAGMAGLTCALTLRDAGIDTVVYESQTRVGGRMHSERTFWDDEQHSEWCGAMIDSKHTAMRTLSSRFGLPTVDTWAALPPRARDTVFLKNSYYPMSDADREFTPVFNVLQTQLKAAGDVTTWDRSTPEGRRLDGMSLAAWIERYVPGGRKTRLGTLIEQAYVNEYGREAGAQSSLNLVYMLGYQLDGYRNDREMNVLGYSDQRFFIDGGNQQLPEAIAASLPAGSLRMGRRLASIARKNGRYALSFRAPSGVERATFDRVVLAIPFTTLRDVDWSGAGFDPRKANAIEKLGYGTHTKLHVQFHGRPWTQSGPWPRPVTGAVWTDLPFQNSVDFSLGQDGASGLIERFTGGFASLRGVPERPYAYSTQSAQVRVDAAEFLAQLEQIWPGVSKHYSGKATFGNAQADPNALGTYSCWLTGQYTTIAGYEGVRQGNVHFAGEHCSIDYQGFMEGAARTGISAAREILADYGIAKTRS